MSKYGVFSGPYFPVFGLNIEKYEPEKTPYLDTFHAVLTNANDQISRKSRRIIICIIIRNLLNLSFVRLFHLNVNHNKLELSFQGTHIVSRFLVKPKFTL